MVKTLGEITTELAEQVLMPAKAQAEKILRDAEAEAVRIVEAAKAEAEGICAGAKREAEEIQVHMHADLDKAARNFLVMVQESLERAVVPPLVEEAVKKTLSDDHLLERLIQEIVTGFVKHRGQESRIEILLPESRQEELQGWLLDSLRARTTNPLTVHFTDKVSFGFKIGEEGTGSHFNFGDGLVQVLSEFCSPRFRRHFFRQDG
jgi:V/A-type H+-transporting ATPase subunit E